METDINIVDLRPEEPLSEEHNYSVEVCGVSLRCFVEVSSRHRHSTPLLSLFSTNSGKSAAEEHCTLLIEAKGTFSQRPAEMGRR